MDLVLGVNLNKITVKFQKRHVTAILNHIICSESVINKYH